MILVTGGTGLLGAHLLYKLARQGEKIRAIYRTGLKLEAVKKLFACYSDASGDLFNSIDWVKADITDVPALDVAFKQVDIVYHCAANLSFNPNDYKVSRDVNVVGTANIVNLCLNHKVTKLCHVSSIATLGENLGSPITEETPWNPENNQHNIYAITKYDAELEVWRGVQEGLNAVVVKPSVILGSGFWNSGTGTLFNKIANGFRYYTSGTVGVVGVNDVVKSMVELVKSDVKNEQFIVVSENMSYHQLMTVITNSFGNTKELKEVVKWQLLLYLRIDQLFGVLNIRKRTVFKANIKSAFKTLTYDASKLTNLLNFKFTPIKAVVVEITENYKSSH